MKPSTVVHYFDAETKAEMDAMADEAMREYNATIPESLAFALEHIKLLTDGVCRITDVVDSQDLPCVGVVWTDLTERFPVFQVYTREQARALIGKRVKLKIHMSARGTRYVTDMMAMPVDTSTEVWPCPKCGGVARLRWFLVTKNGALLSLPCVMEGAEGYEFGRCAMYCCPACLYQMEAKP